MGLNMSWINKQLEAQNAKRISDVYIMTVDGQNNINLVLKEEQH
jgi:uncharacterized membrane protein YcaP (DUF421 family)